MSCTVIGAESLNNTNRIPCSIFLLWLSDDCRWLWSSNQIIDFRIHAFTYRSRNMVIKFLYLPKYMRWAQVHFAFPFEHRVFVRKIAEQSWGERDTAVKHSKGAVCQPVFTWHLDWQQSDWKYPPFTGASPWVQRKCLCSLAVMVQVWIEGWGKMLHSGHSQGGADTVEMMQEQSQSRSALNLSVLLSQCTLTNVLAFIGATAPLKTTSYHTLLIFFFFTSHTHTIRTIKDRG